VFYEVFVRAFADGNGDGIGDLAGILQKLDYLNDGNPSTSTDLGVDGLWLMPVFASPSYHGYDTVDYERINPDYGTADDLKRLLDAAHARGMKVIVDLVVNHTGIDHPWFRTHRDWYVWRRDDPGWKQPWGNGATWHARDGAYYYGIFWSGMPDLNFRNVAVREEIHRLAALWLDRGLDGFRLDAARHIVEDGPGGGQSDTPETHAWWREFAARVRAKRPDALLVGEVWSDTQTIGSYYRELPAGFDFPLAAEIVKSVGEGRAAGIVDVLDEIQTVYPEGALDAPFLTNHDMERVASQLRGDPDALRSAAAVLLTLPGAPFLYYGEEVGLRNGREGGDEAKRTPMPWTAEGGRGWHPYAPGRETDNVATQTGDPRSLLFHYRSWIAARHASVALRTGNLRVLPADGTAPGLLAFWRVSEEGGEAMFVAHNLSGSAVERTLAFVEPGTPRLLVGPEDARLDAPSKTLSLPPHASAVWSFPR
jgi:glycosidase